MDSTLAERQQPRWLSRVKGVYVTLYLTAAMAVTGIGGYQLVQSGFQLGWVGVLLTTAPFLLVLARAFVLKDMARTAEHMTANLVLGLVGVGLALVALLADGLADGHSVPLVVAVVMLLGYIAYDYWYSDLGRKASSLLEVGKPLPEFTVYRADGSAFTSASLKGSPALILFFRGNWCPFCVAQIREIVAYYQVLADRGVKTLFISPQNEKHTQDIAKQFDVPCEFLSDHDNQAAALLGIAAEGGLPVGMEVLGYDSDTVLPTALVVDPQGKIIYSDQTSNYRVRPEPQEYLKILDEHNL